MAEQNWVENGRKGEIHSAHLIVSAFSACFWRKCKKIAVSGNVGNLLLECMIVHNIHYALFTTLHCALHYSLCTILCAGTLNSYQLLHFVLLCTLHNASSLMQWTHASCQSLQPCSFFALSKVLCIVHNIHFLFITTLYCALRKILCARTLASCQLLQPCSFFTLSKVLCIVHYIHFTLFTALHCAKYYVHAPSPVANYCSHDHFFAKVLRAALFFLASTVHAKLRWYWWYWRYWWY